MTVTLFCQIFAIFQIFGWNRGSCLQITSKSSFGSVGIRIPKDHGGTILKHECVSMRVFQFAYQVFALISVAAIIYLFFFYRRLEFVGIGMVTFFLSGLLIRTIRTLIQSLSSKPRGATLRGGRVTTLMSLALAAIVFFFLIPLPHSVVVMGIVRSPDSHLLRQSLRTIGELC